LKNLTQVARKRGYAVGIGHATRTPMLKALKIFIEKHPDVELVQASTLIKQISRENILPADSE